MFSHEILRSMREPLMSGLKGLKLYFCRICNVTFFFKGHTFAVNLMFPVFITFLFIFPNLLMTPFFLLMPLLIIVKTYFYNIPRFDLVLSGKALFCLIVSFIVFAIKQATIITRFLCLHTEMKLSGHAVIINRLTKSEKLMRGSINKWKCRKSLYMAFKTSRNKASCKGVRSETTETTKTKRVWTVWYSWHPALEINLIKN